MDKFKLAFGLHNHQPVGNFDHVFADAHKSAYAPFVSLLSDHPQIRISLHQSGILWDWQDHHVPDFKKAVQSLVDRRQVELLGGGFYEPILVAIPQRDALGQIELLNEYLMASFGVRPTGLWLTERIWEPHLPSLLHQAGVEFLPIDDTHFIYAGMEQDQLTGPFITEHNGAAVKLLPIQKKLRYLIPFGEVNDVLDELKRQAERDPSGVAVYADDGEKFGSWPGTNELCYHRGWLSDLFEQFERNADWLEVIPLGEAASLPPAGRAYLPSASYAEMLQWALPARAYAEYGEFEKRLKADHLLDRFGRFVRGGHWRGFLAKYDEINLMHKKMLSISDRLHHCQEQSNDSESLIGQVREQLYAAQCNCPYWHGVFGGLYLPHLRQAIGEKLVGADTSLRKIEGKTGVSINKYDFDVDGHDEIIIETDHLFALIKPSQGGQLIDLSLRKWSANLCDTLTRRREGYHLQLSEAETANQRASIHERVIAKEEGLKDYLIDDWYPKRCFIDHLLPDSTTSDQFGRGEFRDEGDFVLESYDCEIGSDGISLELTRTGRLCRANQSIELTLLKRFIFDIASASLTVEYELICPGDDNLAVRLAIENNFNFQAGHADDRYVTIDGKRHDDAYLDSVNQFEHVSQWAIIDHSRKLALSLDCDHQSELWQMPIFTVSQSEAGFEKIYQGTTLVNIFRLQAGSVPQRLTFTLRATAAESPTTAFRKNSRVGSR